MHGCQLAVLGQLLCYSQCTCASTCCLVNGHEVVAVLGLQMEWALQLCSCRVRLVKDLLSVGGLEQ